MELTQTLLDSLPQGGILLRENLVTHYNSTALRILISLNPRKSLEVGAPLPAPLTQLLDEDGDSGALQLRGKQYEFSRQVTGEDTLLLFARAEKKVPDQAHSEFLYRLRDSMNQSALGLDGLAQQVIGTQREKVCTILKAHYSMVRALEHIELLRGDRPTAPTVQMELVGYCQRLQSEISSLLKEMDVSLVIQPKDYSLFVQGEEWLLQRLILGLVANAIQQGGRNITLRLSKSHDRCKILILDDCPRKPVAVGPEGQLRQSLLAVPDSLDLSTARRLVKELGGSLLTGEGKMTLAFPLVQGKDLPLCAPDFSAAQRYSQLLVELCDVLPSDVFGVGELV